MKHLESQPANSDVLRAIDAKIRADIPRHIEALRNLCAVPSVSAKHESIEECASLVQEMLSHRGFDVKKAKTDGHPVVLGSKRSAGEQRKTLLFYNHYDVQPAEPLDLWDSPPFELVERDGAVFARGAKDDKGEFVCRLAAMDALADVLGDHPVDVIWLAEGEEEIGSPNLPKWAEANRGSLHADAAIWEEGAIEVDETPIIRLGVRGMLYVRLAVRTLPRDAHSGQANLLPNAAWRLNWALSSLKSADERIAIEGFHEDVRAPSESEEQLLREAPDSSRDLRSAFQLDSLLGGVTDVNRAYFTPTCNIAGLEAGYLGEGPKTVIPAVASAKIDFRLVPDQEPNDILEKLRYHLDRHGFADVAIEVLAAEPPSMTPADSTAVRTSAQIATDVYGKAPNIYPLSGGTTPMYLFTRAGIPVVAPGVGWGQMNRAHSPNEFMRIQDFERAASHIARFALAIGRL